MYEEKIFKEYDIVGFELEPENIVFDWVRDTLHEMRKENYDFADARNNDEYGGFYKISIERFDSKEELKNHQATIDQFL